jgi:hypothetical protein
LISTQVDIPQLQRSAIYVKPANKSQLTIFNFNLHRLQLTQGHGGCSNLDDNL